MNSIAVVTSNIRLGLRICTQFLADFANTRFRFSRLCGGIITIVVEVASKVTLVLKDCVALRVVGEWFHEAF